MPAISTSVSARGVSKGTLSKVRVKWVPGAGTAEGATGTAPPGCMLEWEMRPVCQICRNMKPPLACTASVTIRQPAICSGE